MPRFPSSDTGDQQVTDEYDNPRKFDVDETEVQNGLAALVIGMTQLPVDAFKYPALGANALLEYLNLRDPEVARRVSRQILSMTDSMDFLPEDLAAYRNYIKEEYPNTVMAGTIGLGSMGALAKQSMPYLIQKGFKPPSTVANPSNSGIAALDAIRNQVWPYLVSKAGNVRRAVNAYSAPVTVGLETAKETVGEEFLTNLLTGEL